MDEPHRNQPVTVSGAPLESAQAALILLHGRGATAADIMTVADELALSDFAYLAPQAAGHTWYPYSFLAPIAQNQPWLDSALTFLGTVVGRAVNAGVPHHKIALLGFSQGACLATEFVARNATRYGGLIALTGGLIGPPGTKFAYRGDLSGSPCFFGAGDPDPHVPWERVKESASVFSALGGVVTLRRYPGLSHTINADEISEARQLLTRLVAED